LAGAIRFQAALGKRLWLRRSLEKNFIVVRGPEKGGRKRRLQASRERWKVPERGHGGAKGSGPSTKRSGKDLGIRG
jgi:hypothetical protein